MPDYSLNDREIQCKRNEETRRRDKGKDDRPSWGERAIDIFFGIIDIIIDLFS
ncbi:MAG: hypothetical protein FWE06_01325 [Oscillospiraceae bacterium]|nr:hypothetical protein [Oscillospiraceae bacterium]